MFCIAAFLVFAVLGIFSASYRPLVKKAWHCVVRRITFKPCDINFSEEVKGRMLGKIVLTHPRLYRFLDHWIDWLAFLFVLLSIWSVWTVFVSGLNYWVYDTCNPANVESCSLGGESCGIDQNSLTFTQALDQNELPRWIFGPVLRLGTAISRVPDRLRTWEAEAFVAPSRTYSRPFRPELPTALEVLDPSCQFCKKLLTNVEAAKVEDRYNFTYLLYPIPTSGSGTYKFSNSYLMASYIEATKGMPSLTGASSTPADWLLLKKIFSGSGSLDWQARFRLGMTKVQAEAQLKEFLAEIGFSPTSIDRIAVRAHSKEVEEKLATQRTIVERDLRTIKIPTMLIGGRRYDRVVSVNELSR